MSGGRDFWAGSWDIGLDHWVAPIRNEALGEVGFVVGHLDRDGNDCEGMVRYVTGDDSEAWTLVSRDPLTLEPSIQCTNPNCRDHGYIRDGKWVPA